MIIFSNFLTVKWQCLVLNPDLIKPGNFSLPWVGFQLPVIASKFSLVYYLIMFYICPQVHHRVPLNFRLHLCNQNQNMIANSKLETIPLWQQLAKQLTEFRKRSVHTHPHECFDSNFTHDCPHIHWWRVVILWTLDPLEST